jgi:hypothetical protein
LFHKKSDLLNESTIVWNNWISLKDRLLFNKYLKYVYENTKNSQCNSYLFVIDHIKSAMWTKFIYFVVFKHIFYFINIFHIWTFQEITNRLASPIGSLHLPGWIHFDARGVDPLASGGAAGLRTWLPTSGRRKNLNWPGLYVHLLHFRAKFASTQDVTYRLIAFAGWDGFRSSTYALSNSEAQVAQNLAILRPS